MRALACILCVVAIGCGDSSSGGGGGGSDGGGGAGGGGGDMGTSAPVAVHGTVVGSDQGGGSNPPLAGATVTIAGTTTSTTTAADGTFTLMASSGATIFLTASLADYESGEVGFVVPSGGGTAPQIQLISNAELQQVAGGLSPPLTLDASKGIVVVQFKDAAQTAGYGATLSASHGMSFAPDSQTYTMTTAGGSNEQPLVFPNVATGTTTVAASAPSGKSCTPAQAITNWRVDAKTFTWVEFDCQ